ncbi:dihydropteroate synthase [Arhodomonas sp. SL1]|uniref:dihydropteroate synthase n=1 Tax=Arhodomonas sp. SL1 TaxID=3425691 RepID=UPI003F882E36
MTDAIMDCGGKPLDLSTPVVMGVLNVTPDSFSDGGDFIDADTALERGHRLVAEGAAIVDIGGESTRPGAEGVTEQEELARVLPVLEALAAELPVPVSVDTTKPGVMRAAARAGAGMINDVMALRQPGALEAAAETGLPVCLMHMKGTPRNMQRNPHYDDVIAEVGTFLDERVAACEAAGIPRSRVLLDPGFGFGKDMTHNATLLHHLDALVGLGLPVLVGLSRKSFIGHIVDRPPKERVSGSLAAHVLAVRAGARVIRAHDVAATVDALRVAEFVMGNGDIPREGGNG